MKQFYMVNEDMESHSEITKKFSEIGARVIIREPENRNRLFISRRENTENIFNVDVSKDKKGEFFDIVVGGKVSLEVLNYDIEDRHLLLNAKIPNENIHLKPNMIKALCGHDERHWFTAQVNERATTVKLAKDFLKPKEVLDSQKVAKVKPKKWNKRKNEGFIRQGEWFFIPNDVHIPENLIRRNEPLILAGRRAGAKPHIAQYAYRRGGTIVYVPSKVDFTIPKDKIRMVQSGLSEAQKQDFIKKNPESKSWGWRPMVRDPELYVKGSIKHPDHATINLKTWHRVVVNSEIRGKNVVFLD